ncbi:hypothetical protein HID58_019577, partial [Brassica napus]
DKKGRKVRLFSVADISQREIWSRLEFQRERRWKCKRLNPYPLSLDVPGSPHTYWGRFLGIPETSPSPDEPDT